MYFPEPYPDELIGSVIARACIHLGLPAEELLGHITGLQTGNASMFLPKVAAELAKPLRMSPEQLLLDHTIFPFATAFMPREFSASQLQGFLSATPSVRSTAALVQSLQNNARRYIFCEACVVSEMLLYGETYWHRTHFLPGLHECPVHKCALYAIASNRRAGLPIRAGPLLSDRLNAYRVRPICEVTDFSKKLQQLALATLSPKWVQRDSWMLIYRGLALQKGYKLNSRAVAGGQLAMELQTFLGASVMAELGCTYGKRPTATWPAILMRLNNDKQPNNAPLKHLILLSFLTTIPERTGAFDYIPVGPKTSDYAKLDEAFCAHIQAQWAKARKEKKRVRVSELTEGMSMASTLRHKPKEFPKAAAVLEAFRHSNEAERQSGRRPYWRKRLGLDKKQQAMATQSLGHDKTAHRDISE
ncbi:hypothetical protein GSY71_18400 [Pusillimonas sp. TS35]|nr:hypothetical protein [Pusillimonas sp. TS35]